MHAFESLTTAALSSALDAASLRQQVIAANIANAGRGDYAAQRVSFDATLRSLVGEASIGSPSSASASPPMRPAMELRTRIEPDLAADDSPRPVQLDGEMGALLQNGVHFQALVKGLNKLLSVMAIAVSEAKR